MRRFDVFIIGGGATGSEIALRLGRESRLKIGIAERDRLGGECSNFGCVPTKVMLRSAKIAALARDAARFGVEISDVNVDFHSVIARVRKVVVSATSAGTKPFEDLNIQVVMDAVRLVGPRTVETSGGEMINADRIVLATGTSPAEPKIPGLRGAPYWTNREAIWADDAAPASLAILGAGAIGVEFAQMYRRFGTRVALLESAPRILPSEDRAVSAALLSVLEDEGIDVRTDQTIQRVTSDSARWRLVPSDGETVEVDRLLVATGRQARLEEHDLVAAGVRTRDDHRLLLDETLRTTSPDIWAAGDATGELLFTHVGNYEAGIVVDDILGRPHTRDYRIVPRVTFCDPEVASVGMTEDEATAAGHKVLTSVVSLADNERASIDGTKHGVVKLVADTHTGGVLGGHIVSDGAGAMIHEVVAMMAGHVGPSVIGEAIHAYPTYSESIKAAAAELGTSPDLDRATLGRVASLSSYR